MSETDDAWRKLNYDVARYKTMADNYFSLLVLCNKIREEQAVQIQDLQCKLLDKE